jgi:hypothetical protein
MAQEIPQSLLDVMQRNGYNAYVKPLTYVRGWPHPSTRPFQLEHLGGGHIASFPTLAGLERSFRARACC